MHKYILIRSRRKSMALHIRADLTLEIRAPLKMPISEINKFVISKENWINKKLLLIRERLDKKATFNLNYGDTVLVQGNKYPIVSTPGNRFNFDGKCFCLPPNLTPAQIKSACIRIYKSVAKQVFTSKTIYFAKLMGVMPASVKISSAKTRWGSCSTKKNINYSWRLIMAEDDIIDYVVVHELAHLIEMNHSTRFWKIVEKILPDYKDRQRRLKILQQRLNCENWEK